MNVNNVSDIICKFYLFFLEFNLYQSNLFRYCQLLIARMLKTKEHVIKNILYDFLCKIPSAQKNRTNINTFSYDIFFIFQKRRERNFFIKHITNISIYTYGNDSFYINANILAQEMLGLDCMVYTCDLTKPYDAVS